MTGRYALPAKGLALACLLGVVALFVAWSDGRVPHAHAFHSEEELEAFRGGSYALPVAQNAHFMTSGKCYGCHGPDIVNQYASVDSEGNDVNVMDAWRSSMMANSARDPFWRAKVSHEVSVNPAHQAVLEDKCTSCHAPMGRYNKFLSGGGHYSMTELASDPVGLDGVSCLPCHKQPADSLGLLFSGALKFDPNDVVYGPHENLFGAPMISFVGLDPIYSPHINDAGICAGCHTLITETVDLQGALTGDQFVEQATYHEWLNSSFNTNTDPVNGVTCQGCHMPRIEDAIVISANYLFLEPKSPFGLHDMVGANTFMLKLLKDNILPLELTASPTHFDTTIARTNRMLQQNTLLLETQVAQRDLDTAFIEVKLINLAGHKFPSGYPSRRAFVELVVLNASDDTLFQSGRWNSAYEVVGHDDDWEPHHDVIRTPGQVQIYEAVMGDVNGNKTTVLERAKNALKDNRIAPLGFSTGHISYDTTLIAGVPETDLDFNRDELGQEGTGSDIVHYHVPMNGHAGQIRVEAKVWYQTAPPRWMEEMFAFSTPEISLFQGMYEDADGSPVLVATATVLDQSVGIDDVRELGVRIYPNPVYDGLLRVEGIPSDVTMITVHDPKGSLVMQMDPNGRTNVQLRLPPTPGTYMVIFDTKHGRFLQRVASF
jgi:hypothetical protein